MARGRSGLLLVGGVAEVNLLQKEVLGEPSLAHLLKGVQLLLDPPSQRLVHGPISISLFFFFHCFLNLLNFFVFHFF